MSRTKQKSEFVSGMGMAFELIKAISDAVRELGGGDSSLREVVTDHDLSRQVAEVVMKRVTSELLFPSSAIAAKHGYTVEADVKPKAPFNVADLEYVGFLNEGDGKYVDGDVMRGRAIGLKANFGLVDGMYILDHQDEIPAEIRGKAIVLTGTLLRYSDGGLCVACLCWVGDRWSLDFRWLGYDWFGGYRLPRCK